MPFSFPRSSRILRTYEYQQLRLHGRRLNSRNFTLYISCQGAALPRLGLTVSRKVGGAVVRNRLKRLLREFFRTHRSMLSPGLCLSIVARSSAAGLSYSGICAELEGVLRVHLRPEP